MEKNCTIFPENNGNPFLIHTCSCHFPIPTPIPSHSYTFPSPPTPVPFPIHPFLLLLALLCSHNPHVSNPPTTMLKVVTLAAVVAVCFADDMEQYETTIEKTQAALIQVELRTETEAGSSGKQVDVQRPTSTLASHPTDRDVNINAAHSHQPDPSNDTAVRSHMEVVSTALPSDYSIDGTLLFPRVSSSPHPPLLILQPSVACSVSNRLFIYHYPRHPPSYLCRSHAPACTR